MVYTTTPAFSVARPLHPMSLNALGMVSPHASAQFPRRQSREATRRPRPEDRRQKRRKVSNVPPKPRGPRACFPKATPPCPFLQKSEARFQKEDEKRRRKARRACLRKRHGNPRTEWSKNKTPRYRHVPLCPFSHQRVSCCRVLCKKTKGAVVSRATQLRKSPVKNRCTRWGIRRVRRAQAPSSVGYDGGRREQDSTGRQCQHIPDGGPTCVTHSRQRDEGRKERRNGKEKMRWGSVRRRGRRAPPPGGRRPISRRSRGGCCRRGRPASRGRRVASGRCPARRARTCRG